MSASFKYPERPDHPKTWMGLVDDITRYNIKRVPGVNSKPLSADSARASAKWRRNYLPGGERGLGGGVEAKIGWICGPSRS